MATTAAQPDPRASFRKHERLTGRDRLKLVATTGRSAKAHPFRLTGLLMPLDTIAPAQVAFAIPKRHMKLAVQRNRQRRLFREAYRLNKHRWYEALRNADVQCAWLVVFQGGPVLNWPETQEKITGLFDRWVKEHVRPDR
jgi:ribonuclease P protein component